MIAFFCIIVWVVVMLFLAIVCGLPLEKEKGKAIPIKRYSIYVFIGAVFTFFLLYMYDEHYELLYKFFLAIGVIGIVIYALGISFFRSKR
jgi:hypothetical protein